MEGGGLHPSTGCLLALTIVLFLTVSMLEGCWRERACGGLVGYAGGSQLSFLHIKSCDLCSERVDDKREMVVLSSTSPLICEKASCHVLWGMSPLPMAGFLVHQDGPSSM